jgi:hypothetical protein
MTSSLDLFSPQLFIHKNNEIFIGPFGKKVEFPLFGLTNLLLDNLGSTFWLGSTDDTREILKRWINQVLIKTGEADICYEGKKEHDMGNSKIKKIASRLNTKFLNIKLEQFKDGMKEVPVFLNSMDKEMQVSDAFLLEFILIQSALFDWLSPTGRGRAGSKYRETPSQKFAKLTHGVFLSASEQRFVFKKMSLHKGKFPELKQIALLRDELRRTRNRQFTSELVSLDTEKVNVRSNEFYRQVIERRIISESYTSYNGLLPLVWAEILYAVRYDIFARLCETCTHWFPLEKGKYNQKFCGPKCRSESKRNRQAKKRAEKRKTSK